MRPIPLSFLLALLACSCDAAEQAASPPNNEVATATTSVEVPSVQKPAEDDQAKEPREPTSKVETKTYLAELSVPPTKSGTTLSVGQKAKLLVTIRPRNGWHMNHEFPTSVTLAESEAMATEKTKLEKKDAKRFDDDGADFQLPVEVRQGGKHEAVTDLSFAVCTEQTCLPEKLQLALALDIEEKGAPSKAAEQAP